MKQTNSNNHLTAKEREYLSFPAKTLLNKNLLIGDVLDFGCGFGNDVTLLRSKGINIEGYDKHYFPKYPNKRFDTIICFYVLNVLLPDEQAIVLMELSQLIKPTGKVYIAVRRDIKFEGYRTHKIYQKKTYQCNVILNSKSFLKNDFCEIYEYQHYNQLERTENKDCLLCNVSSETELIAESATVFAIYDKLSANESHILIIPKRHCQDYFELTFKEQSACIFILNKVKEIVSERFNLTGFNVQINAEEKVGQNILHTHIRLILKHEKKFGPKS